LKSKRIDLNEQNKKGETLLQKAKNERRAPRVIDLLEQDPRINSKSTAAPPIEIAKVARKLMSEIIKFNYDASNRMNVLLQDTNVDVNERDANGRTPLDEALYIRINEGRPLEIINLLLQHPRIHLSIKQRLIKWGFISL
jgi:ankyrin repeat protein